MLHPFLTAAEVARLLRRSTWQVYQDAKASLLPCKRLNPRGRILFDEQEVLASLNSSPSRVPVTA